MVDRRGFLGAVGLGALTAQLRGEDAADGGAPPEVGDSGPDLQAGILRVRALLPTSEAHLVSAWVNAREPLRASVVVPGGFYYGLWELEEAWLAAGGLPVVQLRAEGTTGFAEEPAASRFTPFLDSYYDYHFSMVTEVSYV